MKFSVATLSLLFAASSVQGSMLRLNKQVAANSAAGTSIDAEVILQGTEGKPTSEDMDFIGKALVASYNNVHWEVGHYMTGDHRVDFKGPDNIMCKFCPDDDSMGDAATMNVFSVKTPVGIMCKFCPDDDAMGGIESLLMTAVTKDCAGLCKKDADAALEVNFCNKIRSAQGSKYLNSAKSCSIKFDTDADKKQIKHAGSSSNNNQVATIDSTLILKGVTGDATSKEELAVIAKAFVSAYNDVHWDANHYLADAEIPFTAGTPDPDSIMCKFCPDDDSMGGASGASTKTLVLDVVTPVVGIMCKFCPDDDSMGSQFDMESLKTSEFNKKAVEVAFLNKLQNSVSDKLSGTKSLSIAVESVIATTASAKTW